MAFITNPPKNCFVFQKLVEVIALWLLALRFSLQSFCCCQISKNCQILAGRLAQFINSGDFHFFNFSEIFKAFSKYV
jgi:hypothetical protein